MAELKWIFGKATGRWQVEMLQQLNRTLELLSNLDATRPADPCVEETRSRVLETIAAICVVFVAIKVEGDDEKTEVVE
jgi:hypothetical protein